MPVEARRDDCRQGDRIIAVVGDVLKEWRGQLSDSGVKWTDLEICVDAFPGDVSWSVEYHSEGDILDDLKFFQVRLSSHAPDKAAICEQRLWVSSLQRGTLVKI
ncbi:hypothetical protein TNCT_160731 [Trichonephila clavata]|uniref:Uncharacterized protein n=1 Tax=Trichonephila clavata TaxID=2740835 RepID=A0A8X6LNC2_TRICU|nr:hypothetical protein TNCT_160731 [Trichonephila clavata]